MKNLDAAIKSRLYKLGVIKTQQTVKQGTRKWCWSWPPLPEARKKFDPNAEWDDQTEWSKDRIER